MRVRGFTLTEVLLAIALFAMVLLVLVGLTMSTLNMNQKASLLGPATQVSESLITRTIYEVTNDLPPGTKNAFWTWPGGGPWRGPTKEIIGGVEYEYQMLATPVTDVTGVPLGAVAGNRVMKLDVQVWWWNPKPTDPGRAGYGRLEVQGSRLVNETP